MKVIVCGGRHYSDKRRVFSMLDTFDISHVITGGARGADGLAQQWAADREIPWTVYPAQWSKSGRAAGPIRNQQMLDEGQPDLVVAFTGGVGTADMVRKAKQVNVEVADLREEQ